MLTPVLAVQQPPGPRYVGAAAAVCVIAAVLIPLAAVAGAAGAAAESALGTVAVLTAGTAVVAAAVAGAAAAAGMEQQVDIPCPFLAAAAAAGTGEGGQPRHTRAASVLTTTSRQAGCAVAVAVESIAGQQGRRAVLLLLAVADPSLHLLLPLEFAWRFVYQNAASQARSCVSRGGPAWAAGRHRKSCVPTEGSLAFRHCRRRCCCCCLSSLLPLPSLPRRRRSHRCLCVF